MPFSLQPTIRAHEEAVEATGLIKTLDSVGVTIKKASEAAGTTIKVVPKITIKINGHVYVAS